MLVPICWIWTFCRSTSLSLSLTHKRRKRQKCSRQMAKMIGDDLPRRYVLRRDQCKNMRKWVTTGRIPHGDARLGEFSFGFQMHRFFVLISFLFFRFTSWRKTTPKNTAAAATTTKRQQQKSQSIRVHLGEDIGSAIIANGMICDLSPTLNLFFFC